MRWQNYRRVKVLIYFLKIYMYLHILRYAADIRFVNKLRDHNFEPCQAKEKRKSRQKQIGDKIA